MPESSREQHPLDREDTDELLDEPDWMQPQVERERPARPLLKPSSILLAVSFVVAFIWGVLATNSNPNSLGERIGSAVNRGAAMSMLIAFCGILFAYRYESLRAYFDQRQTAVRRPSSPFIQLLKFNGIALLLMWGMLWIVGILSPTVAIVIGVAFIIMQVSLGATMAFCQLGIWRGYGIGLVASALLIISGGSLPAWAVFGQVVYGRATPPPIWGLFPIALMQLFLIVNGLLSAAYVWFLEHPTTPEKATTENLGQE